MAVVPSTWRCQEILASPSESVESYNDCFVRLGKYLAESNVRMDIHAMYANACQHLGIEQGLLAGPLCSNEPVLCLSRCYISKLHVLALAVTLPLRIWTTSIVVGAQRIESTGLQILLASIACLPLLSSVDISCNPIGSVGIMALVRLALQCPSLRSVNIDGIEVIPSVRRKLEVVLASR